MSKLVLRIPIALLACAIHAAPAAAQPAAPPAMDATALAKEAQNPISSVVSAPLQSNFNTGGGLEDQTFLLFNAQPVLPFRLTDRWSMVSRTVLPIVSTPGAEGSRFSGIADIQQQFYFVPPKLGTVAWGFGPVLSLPLATATPFETGSWAAGPTFVALAMPGAWVVGGLVNNIWTFADAGDGTEVNQFFLQPFVNYNFGKGWALMSVPVITANWDAESGQQWTVPVGLGIGRTTVFSGQAMSLSLHYYHNVVHPDSAAADTVRFQVVLLYPKR